MSHGGPPVELILRVDATPRTGAGHAMRLAAVAEAWRKLGAGGVRVHGTVGLEFARRRFAELGASFGSGDLDRVGVLVVDSYDPALRRAGAAATDQYARVMVDDLGEPVPGGYDAVWNPNAYGTAALYSAFQGPVWAGPDYVPLHAGLPRWEPRPPRRTAVVLGGGQIASSLAKAVRQLPQRIEGVRLAGLGAWVPESWDRLPAENPWNELAACDRLVTAAGVTVWEAAAVGIPSAVVQTACNQRLVAEWVRAAGGPVVDACVPSAPESLADALASALGAARPLPPITNGAERVARRLLELAAIRTRHG